MLYTLCICKCIYICIYCIYIYTHIYIYIVYGPGKPWSYEFCRTCNWTSAFPTCLLNTTSLLCDIHCTCMPSATWKLDFQTSVDEIYSYIYNIIYIYIYICNIVFVMLWLWGILNTHASDSEEARWMNFKFTCTHWHNQSAENQNPGFSQKTSSVFDVLHVYRFRVLLVMYVWLHITS